jgi:lipopolysaccharide biosynthesis glycosyltransferase
MNLDDWRLHRHTEALFGFIQRGIGLDSWPDQNALNAVLWQRRLSLHPRWNVQSVIFELPDNKLPYPTDEIRRARSDPSIIHYVGPYKPWHYRSKHPFRSLYFIHLEATPWRGRPIEGRTLFHILLRPLPWVLGLRIETRIRLFLLRLRKMLSST